MNHEEQKEVSRVASLLPQVTTTQKEQISIPTPSHEKNTTHIFKKNSPEEEYQEEIEIPSMYKILSMEEAISVTKPRRNITPITAIEIETKQLKKNDILKLPDIEGVDYEITITSIQTNASSITSTGSFTDEGIKYSTTITQSNNESFITLSTPKGTYEIETRNGVGYIYSTQDIRKHLQKGTKDDVIILPIPKEK
jgi:hypothetical protein